MKIKSLRTADTKGKRVLVRVDFNIPLEDGKIADDTRIKASLLTINYLVEDGAKVILMSHLGRPDGEVKDDLKMNPIADCLNKLLDQPVKKMNDCIGEEVKKAIENMNPGEIILLENTRFHKEEEQNDPAFSKQLAELAELFIVDSFGTAHRKHASNYGVSKHLPTYAGFLMEKEIQTLTSLMQNSPKPLTLIMGGAKINTKIGLMRNFLNKADYFLIGGALANTFLAAQGFNVADSLYEEDKTELAREIMLEAEIMKDKFILPTDVIVADEIADNAETVDIPVRDVEGKMKILDIGKNTIEKFNEIIKNSGTIIWNGPMGLYEKEPFENGSKAIAKAVSEVRTAKTIIGGGDTIDAIKHFGIGLNQFTHVSTGGGAMLQLLEGTSLPGVEIVTIE